MNAPGVIGKDGQPSAAVIVCTRNRSKLLGRCLESICEDTSTVSREIIVVDNDSTDDTAEVVSAASKNCSWPIRLIREPEVGLSRARNRGLAATSAGIAVFTDDDVRVCSGWADSLVRRFDDPSVGAVGGRISPDWEHPPPEWLRGWWSDVLALHDYGSVPIDLSPEQPPIGANMAVRYAALPAPAFSIRLGYRGAAKIGSEEFQLFDIVGRQYRIVYEPSAVVRHFIPATRMTRSAMRRACLHNGMGASRRDAMRGLAPNRVRAMWALPGKIGDAFKIKRRNDRRQPFTSEEADAEFLAFIHLGRTLDVALGSKPGRVADWITSLHL